MAIYVSDEQALEADLDRLYALATHVVAAERIPVEMELSIILVDVETMTSYNKEHMGKDGPTDVLAFPIDEPGESMPDGPSVLGDVVLCPTVAYEQAPQFSRSPHGELEMLTVHGILHLIGMDHADPETEREMFARTEEILASFAAGGDG